jgi:hypothetical protein
LKRFDGDPGGKGLGFGENQRYTKREDLADQIRLDLEINFFRAILYLPG